MIYHKLLFMLSTALCLTLSTHSSTLPVRKLLPIENVYTPQGFDSNDSVEIVLTGYLPSLCYENEQVVTKRENNSIYIEVSAVKPTGSDQYCKEMTVPFTKVIQLGKLERGQYDIVANENIIESSHASLMIAPKERGPIDNYKYPQITRIDKNYATREVTLKGYFPSDCFQLDRIEVIDNQVNTYTVMPIISKVKQNCSQVLKPFIRTLEVPDVLSSEFVLLHVRSLGNRSYNTLFNTYLR